MTVETLLLTTDQRNAVRGITSPGHELEPVLIGGTYTLPGRVLEDPAHAAKHEEMRPFVRSRSDFHFCADSVNGDDGAAGTLAAPFKTWGALCAAALLHGNGVIIGAAFGSRFAEDGDLSSIDGLIYQAFGDPADGLPLWDGSIPLEAEWQDSTDRGDADSGLYSVDVVQTFAQGYISLWRSDVKPLWQASKALTKATAFSFWIADDGTGSGKTGPGTHRLFFRPPDGVNPKTDNAEYRVTDATRSGAFKIGEDGLPKHFHCRRPMQADGAFTAGHGTVAVGGLFSDGVKHEALMNSGEYDRCLGLHLFDDARTNNIVLEFYAGDGVGYSIRYTNCAVRGPGNTDGATTQAVVALGGHNQGAGTYYDALLATDIAIADCAVGMSNQLQMAARVERAYIENCETGIATVCEDARVVVVDPWLNGIGDDNKRPLSGGPFDVEGLRLYQATDCDAVMWTLEDSILRRSVVVFATASFGALFRAGSGVVISLLGTIVENRGSNDRLQIVEEFATPPLSTFAFGEIGNNVYSENAGEIGARVGNVVYGNVAAFLAAYPEPGTLRTSPGLVSPATGDFSHTNPAVTALGAGLERPDIEYMPVPATIAEAEAWILANT